MVINPFRTHGGDYYCLLTRPPALEVARWQLGKADVPAVRSDKKECVVTHLDILSDSSFRQSRIAKEGCRRIKVRTAGLSRFPTLKEVVYWSGMDERVEQYRDRTFA